MTTMHCLGDWWCGLRGRGCNLWPMGERVAFVALVSLGASLNPKVVPAKLF